MADGRIPPIGRGSPSPFHGYWRKRGFTHQGASDMSRQAARKWLWKFVKFIVIGALFAAVGEYWFSYIIRRDINNWYFTLGFNPSWLVVVYFTSRIIFRAIKNRFTANTVYYLTYGFAGLIIIEWFLVGNSPWRNPQANQLGMFSYHATTAMTSLIFVDQSPTLARLKKAILAYFVPYSLAGTVIGFLLPTYRLRLVVLVWTVIIGYTLMHGFYIWYLSILRQNTLRADVQTVGTADTSS